MQKEKIDIPFLKYWKSITYCRLIIKKAIDWPIKGIKKLFFLFSRPKNNNISNNGFLLKKITPYVFSGFSIIFIGYLIMNILTNYPPKEIGISP
jgi:hypothetical protein